MSKIILIAICFSVSVSLAISKDESKTLTTEKLDVLELAGVDSNDEGSSESQRKRDSGYSYPRPDRVRFRSSNQAGGPGRYVMRLPTNVVKPFNRYGPPKQASLHLFINPTRRPQSQQHKNKYPSSSESIRFPSNNQPTGVSQLKVPSPIRGVDFTEASPIASQNEEAFKLHSANYLPPRNQKLPTYSAPSMFQRLSRFNSNINSLSQNLIQNPPLNPQISDAAQFLTQNSQAISQLYETPATNINYEPLDDSQGSNNQELNPNSQFQTFDITRQSQQSSRDFPGPLPSYSSGFLESQQALEQIQSAEKDRLIAQLQETLTQQDSALTRYAQNHGNYLESQRLLSSIATQTSPLDKPINFNAQDVAFGTTANTAFGQSSFWPGNTVASNPTSYGVSTSFSGTQTPSTTISTSTTASSGGSAHRPQDTAGGGSSHVGTLVPTPGEAPTVLPFPQYGGFVPTLIAGTNFLTGLPNYGNTFVASSPSHSPGQTTGSSPTYFGIPIPTTSDNKPPSLGPSSSPASPKPGFPTAGHPLPLPGQPIHPHPIPATPVQPIFPIVPAVTSAQTPSVSAAHPTYGVQPTLVNSVVLKPVKPVYPVYYYPNVAYQVQKPTLPTFPWNYAPSYAQTKPAQIWK